MTQEQLAYLRARELEGYFHEKVDLEYKGENGLYSEFNVTHINNRPFSTPITLGFCQYPYDAAIYLSADLSAERLGTAELKMDLNQDRLDELRTGKSRIMFLSALQSAIEDRPLANAESLTNQPFLQAVQREISKITQHPLKQVGALTRVWLSPLIQRFTGRQEPPDTVRQGGDELFLTGASSGFRPSATYRFPDDSKMPVPEPITVRSLDLDKHSWLNPDYDYELSFSESIEHGHVCPYCTFTPINAKPFDQSLTYPYTNIHLMDGGLSIHVDDDYTIPLAFSELDREQTHEGKHLDSPGGERLGESKRPEHEHPSLDTRIASASERSKQQPQRHMQRENPLHIDPSR